MKNLVHHLSTSINGIAEWAVIFYVVFPLFGFIASLMYLVKKEKIKAEATACYALLGLLVNIIFYMMFGR
ncbi:MAG: hypothetical protein K2O75_10025 [Lactobacillus sp.]|uniref:hypothetical protein n=1 Tax=Lactobacillus sp. TaxID=1591 RepID=UPI0023D57FA7|nr:hypothetical protein [Lactobacillus sp.]MDE7051180.1 hypothetical protein [Lactobacillus sp.]